MQAMSFEYYRKGRRETSTKPLGYKEEWASLLSLNGGEQTIRNKNLNFYPFWFKNISSVLFLIESRWLLWIEIKLEN